MSLSSLIVQREIATIREVEEALARQVLYGGDLVTNLLEVATVNEAHLTELLAESYGMQAAPPGPLPSPPADARAIVPAELCVQKNLVPLSVDRAGVTVAVSEPLPLEVEQELSFALSLPVAQRVAPHVRVREAIARAYGAPLERRFERLLARLAGTEARVPNSMPPLLRDPPAVRQPPRPPSDLPGAQSLPVVHLTARRSVPEVRVPSVEVPPAAATGFTPAESLGAAAAAAAPPASSPPAPRAPSASPASRPPRGSRLRPLRRRRGPLVADVAQDEMEAAEERDAILDLFFEYCRQYFDYTALLIVQGDLAEGWDAFGAGASRERIVEIGIPLDMPSMLASARSSRLPVSGRPEGDGLDGVWTKDLGIEGRSGILVAPLVVRGRVVALLVGDGGEGGVDAESVREATWFAGLAGAAFERVIVAKKKRAKSAPAAAPPAPVAPAAREAPAVREAPAAREPAPPVEASVAPSSPPQSPGGRSAPPADIAVAVGQAVSLDAIREVALARSSPPEATPTVVDAPVAPLPTAERGSDPALSAQERLPATLATPVAYEASPAARLEPPSSLEEALSRADALLPRTERDLPPTPTEPPEPEPAAAPIEPAAAPIEPAAAPIDAADASSAASSSAASSSAASSSAASSSRPRLKLEIVDEGDRGDAEPTTEPDPPAPTTPEPAAPDPSSPRISIADVPPVTRPEGHRHALLRTADSHNIGPAPSSDHRSVAPHKPPSSQMMPPVLPSVIVDVASDFAKLVGRYIDEHDERALSELLRAGQHAMPAIMTRFPGPITIEDRMLESPPLPRASRCGPLMKLIAGQRKVALPFVLEMVGHPDATLRFWATLLVVELPYAEAVEPVGARVFDEDARVRSAARAAARAVAEHHSAAMVDRLARVLRDPEEETRRRVLATRALGEIRDALAVPALIEALADGTAEVCSAAQAALVVITRRDLGPEARKWRSFWQSHGGRHRIEWLIDALSAEDVDAARGAADELVEVTRQDFGFAAAASKRDRDRSQGRYREWWSTEGRYRFAR